MQRNMDLIRAILMEAEATPANKHIGDVHPEGSTSEEIAEHVDMMIDGGLIEGTLLPSGMGGARIAGFRIKKVTWRGREFLDAIRNDEVWQQTKDRIAAKGDSVPLTVAVEIATDAARKYFLED